ncbi:MAG: hypothetical protein H7328_04045 [Bdellovibrio sp.]|nr:hypothetical protein [Bdellovibrio sp.]
MKIKNMIRWTLIGGLFGVAFGAVAALFQNGPTVWVGIQQSWWWFAFAGFLKGSTDHLGSKR